MKRSLILSIFLLFAISQGCKKTIFDYIGIGGYDNAEYYKTSASREKVISAILTFKKQNPTMCPPDSLKVLTDGYHKDIDGNDNTIFYYVYYYYQDEENYVSTFIDGNGTIGLIGIGNAKIQIIQRVNIELTGSKNQAVKNEFVTRILNPIKKILSGQ